MSKRCIVTYAAGAHEELLDISLPLYKDFARRHGYDIHVGHKILPAPPAWNKVPLLAAALTTYDEVVWFDCDLVIVDPSEDFPPMEDGMLHSLVRHFEHHSEVPNSGVWRLCKSTRDDLWANDLLHKILKLEVFTNHGWWEQAALLTLMGYCVPPEGSNFRDTRCRCVHQTIWYRVCQFMRLCWNSHPNYRAAKPKIVHCSYASMPQRIEVMRELVKNPAFDYPRYDVDEEDKE